MTEQPGQTPNRRSELDEDDRPTATPPTVGGSEEDDEGEGIVDVERAEEGPITPSSSDQSRD